MDQNKDVVKMVVNSYGFILFLIIVGLLNFIQATLINVVIGLVAIGYGIYMIGRKLKHKDNQLIEVNRG